MNKSSLLLLIQILLGACATNTPEPAISTPLVLSPDSELKRDVYEACFRYMFEHNASGRQQSVAYYFLLVKGHDPDERFLARFASMKPKVVPVSLSISPERKGVLHKKNRRKGIIFYLKDWKQISDDEFEIKGGYYEAFLSSSGNRYTVKRINDTWVVTKDEMEWIS